MAFPVTVGVPLTRSRRKFFDLVVRPAIDANEPGELLIDDADEHANIKRNRLMKAARYPYVLLCDDDVVLSRSALSRFLAALQDAPPDVGYAYGDFLVVNHPTRKDPLVRPGPFDPGQLRRENYISMISLIRKAVYPGMDPGIDRFQDWDLWLTMLERGFVGAYIPPRKEGDVLFTAYYNGDGITKSTGKREAADAVRRKHLL